MLLNHFSSREEEKKEKALWHLLRLAASSKRKRGKWQLQSLFCKENHNSGWGSYNGLHACINKHHICIEIIKILHVWIFYVINIFQLNIRLMMGSLKKIDAAETEILLFFIPSSFSKSGAYLTHNATWQLTVQSEIWVCLAVPTDADSNDITSGTLSEFVQLRLELQKASFNFFHICSIITQDL